MDVGKEMTQLDEAIALILSQVEPLKQTELVSLKQANGRVLAQEVRSRIDVPAFDNSAMDGYGLRHADLSESDVQIHKGFAVSQRIPAGHKGGPLQPGTVVRIFTGAPVPPGVDVVIQQEHAIVKEDGTVAFTKRHKLGANIRKAGEDIEAGSVVIPAGRCLRCAEIGVAASVGLAELEVFRKPKVALFVTGDELAEPGEVLKPGGIYNSNAYVMYDLLQQSRCDVSDGGIIRDSLTSVQAHLKAAAQTHDLILTSGGVSVGEEDHVKHAVMNLGSLKLWKLAFKPGKPLAFGQINRDDGSHAWFLGLPGNPVATFVTFLMVVRPFLQKLAGQTLAPVQSMQLKANFESRSKDRREFWRARINDEGSVDLYPNQGSGVLTSMAWAHGFVDVAAQTHVKPGDVVRYIPLTALGA